MDPGIVNLHEFPGTSKLLVEKHFLFKIEFLTFEMKSSNATIKCNACYRFPKHTLFLYKAQDSDVSFYSKNIFLFIILIRNGIEFNHMPLEHLLKLVNEIS